MAKTTKQATTKRKAQQVMVLVRTYSAGVHFGRLVRRQGKGVVLARARRIWSWSGANTLHEISLRGVNLENSRISEAVPQITLTEAIEILPMSPEATRNLERGSWK